MGKIATEQEAYSIGQSGSPMANKCCTKERAQALGCDLSQEYETNQLVEKDSLIKNFQRVYLSYKIDNALNYVWFKIDENSALNTLAGTSNFPLTLPICYYDGTTKHGFSVTAPIEGSGYTSIVINESYQFNAQNLFKITHKPYGSPKISYEYDMNGQTFNYGNKKDINVFTRYQGDYSLT